MLSSCVKAGATAFSHQEGRSPAEASGLGFPIPSPPEAKPPRPAAHGQGRPPRAAAEETSSAANDASAGPDDDLDGDEWIEVDEGYEEVDEAEAYDRDDNMSEPSLGLGENQDDTEVEVNDNERTKKGGKRKKEGVAVGKVKERRTRVKRAECWKHFKEVKAISKKKPGEVVTKAKCLHCCELFAYTPGGSTTSLNRHKDSCSIYLNKKGRQLRQGTINLDPEKPGASLIVNHEYDHTEVNLIVNDGIDPLQPLIGKLRDTVKYLKRSPLRMGKLLEVCESLNIKVGKGLCLDVSTRWSSTYKMVDACTLYRAALDEYAQTDPTYKWQPSAQDWTLYGNIQPILKSFAEVTTVLSGSKYPTANIFYPYIMNVKIAINKHAAQKDDHNLKAMGQAMLDKFDKYWDSTYAENGNDNNVKDKRKVKNNVMVIATILDPRFKMKLVEYCFKELYGREKGMSEAEDIKTEFFDLYATYEMENRQNGAASSNEQVSVSTRQTASSMSTLSSGFQSFLEETNSEPCKSELTSYLEDKTHPILDPNFALLDWWRLNAHRYPIMAKMAKKFLTVPATSVSSESTFSTGGRVLDDYRSSLRPKMVEALVCAASFIKGSKENHVKPTIIVEDDSDDDVEFIPFPESSVESN